MAATRQENLAVRCNQWDDHFECVCETGWVGPMWQITASRWSPRPLDEGPHVEGPWLFRYAADRDEEWPVSGDQQIQVPDNVLAAWRQEKATLRATLLRTG